MQTLVQSLESTPIADAREWLNTPDPPLTSADGQAWLQAGKKLCANAPDLFLSILDYGNTQERYNAMMALRANGYEVLEVGYVPGLSYAVTTPTGARLSIRPRLQQVEPLLRSDDLLSTLVLALKLRIDFLRLTQMEAKQITGIPQAKISGLLQGKEKAGVSEGRLLRALTALGADIEITVSMNGQGRLTSSIDSA